MTLVEEKAEEYAGLYTSSLDAVRDKLCKYTLANHSHANMLSGPVQGKALEFLSKLVRPSKILEVGTFTGFSALCLVAGLHEKGELHTIELREEDATLAQKFFDASAFASQLHLHLGNALNVIPTLNYDWDLIFIDADKVNYINYYELTLPKLKTGGLIIADNVLFHGDVLQTPIKGKNAIAIHAFNEHVKNDPRVEQVMFTIRDGLMLIRKL